MGQFEEAIAHYEIALSKASGDNGQEAVIYYNKGLAYASLMKWEQAINDYRLACEKINDPTKDQKERFQLGVTLRRIDGKLNESISELKKACEGQNTKPNYINNLGLSYFENEQW